MAKKKSKYLPCGRKKKKRKLGALDSIGQQKILQQALSHHQAGRLHQAEKLYRQILLKEPSHHQVLNYLGALAHETGNSKLAIELISKAIASKPDYFNAFNNLGLVFNETGMLDEAVTCYRRALTLNPDYALAYNNLGNTLIKQGKLNQAIACFKQAIALKPDFADTLYNLGNVLKDQGKLDEAVACYRQALNINPDYTESQSNLLFCLNYFPSQSDVHYLDEARNYGRKVTNKVSVRYSDWDCLINPRRLSVGMVSGNFYNHPIGYFLENFLANINTTQINLTAYPTTKREDELTSRIRSHFVAWKPLLGMNDKAAAQLIYNDGIHILIDLSGHTANNRLPVFAWKPAPIQVSWLGYSASTGLAEMDYLLADPYVVPPGEETHFTETIWRLPESYLCFSHPKEMVAVGPLPALKEGRITFGCFNNPNKMNDSVVDLWAKVMCAVPESRLVLKSKRFSDPAICEIIRQRFAVSGITAERLILKSFAPNREEHLAVYNQVDIALDPFPYNGTTTSVEGLWMGVPFLTLRGDRFVSHVGESIAYNTGLTDWVADDAEDYVAKAVAKTTDLEALARLRVALRQRLLASPLCNGPRFATNFETAMWEMWRQFNAEHQSES